MLLKKSSVQSEAFIIAILVKSSKLPPPKLVVVGSVVHPMTPEHYIQWIVLETKSGFQVKELTPTCEPKASFVLAEGDEIVAVYEYCNLHNLWKA